MMTVKQLRDRLTGIPDDAIVGIRSDSYTFGLSDWPVNKGIVKDDDGNESIGAIHLWEAKSDLSLMEARDITWTMV